MMKKMLVSVLILALISSMFMAVGNAQNDERGKETGNSGMNGIQEAIKTGVIEQITKENRVVVETNFIEKLFAINDLEKRLFLNNFYIRSGNNNSFSFF